MDKKPEEEYKEVPISAAEEIAERFDKDQVIIATWDAKFGVTHITTFGKGKENKVQAAQGGNFIKMALDWPEELCNEKPDLGGKK